MASGSDSAFKSSKKQRELSRSKCRNKIKCKRCGRTLTEKNYYMDRHGKYLEICRGCLCVNIDNRKPTTFLWILRDFDIAFIPELWLKTCKEQYRKNPEGFGPSSVLGIYMRIVKMSKYRVYGYDQSDDASDAYRKLHGMSKVGDSDMRAEAERRLEEGDYADDIERAKLESLASDKVGPSHRVEELLANQAKAERNMYKDALERRTVKEMQKTDPKRLEEIIEAATSPSASAVSPPDMGSIDAAMESAPPSPPKKAPDGPKEKPKPKSPGVDVSHVYVPTKTSSQLAFSDPISDDPRNQEDVLRVRDMQLKSTENAVIMQLTQDDVRKLAVKWGESYKPTEWVSLERMFCEYANEYEMNVDREQVLVQMCKVNMAMNNAIEDGDFASYSKLASTFDQLRKSGKFTEAQNKAEKETYIDSVGELVAAVEREGGIIPQFDYKVQETQDKVDITLQDMKAYTYNLVKNEMGLGDIIETYISKLEEDIEANKKKDLKDGITYSAVSALTDDYMKNREEEVEAEADELFSSLDMDGGDSR